MKPSIAKQIKGLNIVIYAQSGILAGDLAALLSGQNTVDRITSLPGIIKSINSQTDLLLLVSGGPPARKPDLLLVLMAAKQVGCKVIMLGDWSGFGRQHCSSAGDSVTILEEIPSPLALFEIIGSTIGASS